MDGFTSPNAVPNKKPTFYDILGVSRHSSSEQITAEFRLRARSLHPDKNPLFNTTFSFQQLHQAREVLLNPSTRQLYDAWLISGIDIPFDKWMNLMSAHKICIHWVLPEVTSRSLDCSKETSGPWQRYETTLLKQFRNYEV